MEKNESSKIKKELIDLYLAIKLRKEEDVIIKFIIIKKILIIRQKTYQKKF